MALLIVFAEPESAKWLFTLVVVKYLFVPSVKSSVSNEDIAVACTLPLELTISVVPILIPCSTLKFLVSAHVSPYPKLKF